MALHEPPLSAQAAAAAMLQGQSAPIVRAESDLEFGDIEEFEDALEPSMTLKKSMEDCEIAIEKFFSNNVKGAISVMIPWKDKSLYHSHGAAIFEFIPAMLTMDPQQLQVALAAVKDTFALCNRQRRCYSFVESLGTIIKKPNYGIYSEVEAHAELIHAEALLVQACLVALEGEDLTGLVRATLRIKNSHDSYKDCVKILEKKTRWDDTESRVHFESGVRMGVATFNVMVSLLPPKLITLLEFVGFSGDKEYGLSELLIGAKKPGLRSVLCSMTLLVHNLVIGQFAAIPPDYELAQKLIDESLSKYPDSAWFLMFKGRLALLLGKPAEAIEIYKKAANTSGLWPQLIHLAYWETMWAYAMLSQWDMSAEYAKKLLEESMWSRTVYAYTLIAASLQQTKPPDSNWLENLIQSATNYRQRILGRSVPMEKFALRRCERLRTRGHLVLPGTEMLCLWNMYPAIAKDAILSDRLLKEIEDTHKEIERTIKNYATEMKALTEKAKTEGRNGDAKKALEEAPKPKYDADDLALVRHLRGSILLAMNFPRLALEHFDDLLKDKDDIKENTYLVPYTMVEMAMCQHHLGDSHLALRLLTDARKKSGYPLESRLQFRIHSKIEMIRNQMEVVKPSIASHAKARTKLDVPGTLGTQGNLVVTTPPIPVPEDEEEEEDDKKKGKKKDKQKQKEKEKSKKDSPVAGTSKDFKDTMITTDGVVIAQPRAGDSPLTMRPGKQSNK
ncbi:unnamed protein product [Leptosia nina]|uniref:Tetratricopeptide repeat protein 39B n=1 Tax=Leptosia nina TaxID=320188 RepID=A0AAV1K211_9NEOP